MEPYLEHLIDEPGYPPWVWPAPSLRLLAPRDANPQIVVIRYAPQVAGRFTQTPARHYSQVSAG